MREVADFWPGNWQRKGVLQIMQNDKAPPPINKLTNQPTYMLAALEILFWTGTAVVFYAYLGYGLVLAAARVLALVLTPALARLLRRGVPARQALDILESHNSRRSLVGRVSP